PRGVLTTQHGVQIGSDARRPRRSSTAPDQLRQPFRSREGRSARIRGPSPSCALIMAPALGGVPTRRHVAPTTPTALRAIDEDPPAAIAGADPGSVQVEAAE